MGPAQALTPKKTIRRPHGVWVGIALCALLGIGGYFAGPHVVAFWHWHAAQTAQDRRDFHGAHDELVKCLRAWTNNYATHLAAARNARRAGLYAEAAEHLRACQLLEEDESDETRLEYNLLLARRDGMTLLQEKYLQDSLRQGYSDSLDVLEALTDEYMRLDRYGDAQVLLKDWLERRPDDVEALVRRGWVWDHLLDFERTRADYEKALTLDPNRDTVRLRLADILLLNNRTKEARTHVELLRSRNPEDPAVAVVYARYLVKVAQTSDARQVLDEALARRPEDPQLLSERGKVALDEHLPADAERYLRRALAPAPRDRQVIYTMIQCLHVQKKKLEAMPYEDLLKAIDQDVKSIGELRTEVMRSPYNADLRSKIGGIFLKNGQIDDAMHWFAGALEIDQRHRATHEALAGYYERAGEQDRARKHRRILAEMPSKP